MRSGKNYVTPVDLETAIQNGLNDGVRLAVAARKDGEVVLARDVMAMHVRDFLAQKFCVSYLEAANDPAVLEVLKKLARACGLEGGK
jgi:hypothetical protein